MAIDSHGSRHCANLVLCKYSCIPIQHTTWNRVGLPCWFKYTGYANDVSVDETYVNVRAAEWYHVYHQEPDLPLR